MPTPRLGVTDPLRAKLPGEPPSHLQRDRAEAVEACRSEALGWRGSVGSAYLYIHPPKPAVAQADLEAGPFFLTDAQEMLLFLKPHRV